MVFNHQHQGLCSDGEQASKYEPTIHANASGSAGEELAKETLTNGEVKGAEAKRQRSMEGRRLTYVKSR